MYQLILSTSLVLSLSTIMAASGLPVFLGPNYDASLSTSQEMASVQIPKELLEFVTKIDSNGQIALKLTKGQYDQFKELIDRNERFTVTISPSSACQQLVIPDQSLPTSPNTQQNTFHVDPYASSRHGL